MADPRSDKQIYLLISAHFETPRLELTPIDNRNSPAGVIGEWRPLGHQEKIKVEEVYREEVPGTDIAITVDAASQDGVFPKLVRECLQKPPESIQPEVARLTEQIKNEKDSARASRALVRAGEYAPVIAALSSTNLTIQREAVIGLAGFNHHVDDGAAVKNAVLPLIHLLQTSDSYTRYLAAWALGHVHEEEATTVDALIVALDDNHEQVSTAAQMSLGEFKSQEKVIVPAMIKKLSDTNAAVRAQATRTLGELSPCQDKGLAKMVVAALIKSLADTNNNVRGGAAWALGDNGEAAKDAIPELLELTNSDDKYLRNEARAALMAIDFEAAKKAGLVN